MAYLSSFIVSANHIAPPLAPNSLPSHRYLLRQRIIFNHILPFLARGPGFENIRNDIPEPTARPPCRRIRKRISYPKQRASAAFIERGILEDAFNVKYSFFYINILLPHDLTKDPTRLPFEESAISRRWSIPKHLFALLETLAGIR